MEHPFNPGRLIPSICANRLILMKKKTKPCPKLARCRYCGNERPATIQEFSRQSAPRCSACRIGVMEYIGTKREPPKPERRSEPRGARLAGRTTPFSSRSGGSRPIRQQAPRQRAERLVRPTGPQNRDASCDD